MKLHKREENVRLAKIKMLDLISELRKDLTEGELLRLLTETVTGEWSGIAKWMIRDERHPEDPNKPGGIE